MKKNSRKSKKVSKGMPAALVLSITIHLVLFLLAGMLVVFTVVKKEDKQFDVPKVVERPKMKLKKPKVKIKENSKPKSTAKIATTMKKSSMPVISLPELGGVGTGLGDGIGDGFGLMPDLGDTSVFGSGQSIGNDLEGTFYDLKRDRAGRGIGKTREDFASAADRFLSSGWAASTLARYYQSPKKLYATTIMMPPMLSSLAPDAFGERDIPGYGWFVHYKGQLVHSEGITFRFVGKADDLMFVRVNGEVVLNGSHDHWLFRRVVGRWQSSSADAHKWRIGGSPLANVGDWITLEPGVPQPIEVLIGEIPGGTFSAMLCVQEKDVEYERASWSAPILPIFKTSEPSRDLADSIYNFLIEDGASLTNGPVFSDYDSSSRRVVEAPEAPEPSASEALAENKPRIWTEQGVDVEARFVTVIGDDVVLKDAGGQTRKVPLAHISDNDRRFVGLAQPPKFNISFSKQSTQRILEPSPLSNRAVPRILLYTFSSKLKQISAGSYDFPLQVEFFAIGKEIDGNNYILLDRQQSSFVPSRENERSHQFSGRQVELMDYNYGSQRRGATYGGYLVVVTDERGIIIDHETSQDWLFDNLERLKKIPVSRHFDKSVTRVYPPRPKRTF